jgi:ubiquinone/menaquinone biosynthesis C-methylase UbiE
MPQSRVLKEMDQHTRKIVDEFSKQAIYFAKLPGHAEATRLIIEMAGVSPDDDVLDVACGAGSVTCAAARTARHITGIDVTPAMIEQAQALQAQHDLSNLSWHIGDVTQLPFATNTFDVILTRYSFHHFIDAATVLAEMVRVCKPAGRVVVADLVLPPEKISAYDRMERLRDSTHVGVLAESELFELFTRHGLRDLQCAGYAFDLALDQLMQASFPSSCDADCVREMIASDLGIDDLGINVHRRDDALWLSYPIAVVVGRKEA